MALNYASNVLTPLVRLRIIFWRHRRLPCCILSVYRRILRCPSSPLRSCSILSLKLYLLGLVTNLLLQVLVLGGKAVYFVNNRLRTLLPHDLGLLLATLLGRSLFLHEGGHDCVVKRFLVMHNGVVFSFLDCANVKH